MLAGIIAAGAATAAGGGGPIDLSEPWGEVARQETLASGKLTIAGLDLTGIQVVRLYLNGVTVTTDDSQVLLTYLIGGSEVTAGYRWALRRLGAGVDGTSGSNSDSAIHLTSAAATQGVGNASTEGFDAVVTVYHPGGSLFKRANWRSVWSQPDGTVMQSAFSGAALDNTGAITGFVVAGSSDLTAGTVIVLGVE